MKTTLNICKNGHDLSVVGTYKIKHHLRCKACHVESAKRSKAKLAKNRSHQEELVGKEVDRFMAKVRKTDTCWIWTGANNGQGYGLFAVAMTNRLAHRVSYCLHVGRIGNGLEVDHLCRNRSCVNPDHLEPVSHQENVIRSVVAVSGKPYRVHGDRNAYCGGCRCPECVAAARQYWRELRARRKNAA